MELTRQNTLDEEKERVPAVWQGSHGAILHSMLGTEQGTWEKACFKLHRYWVAALEGKLDDSTYVDEKDSP